MSTSFCCVIYRPAQVSERALAHGFGVALAGFAVHSPTLLLAELRGIPGWSVAFYQSGQRIARFEELDHGRDLFEDELPPGLAVLDALDAPAGVVVHALVYSDDFPHDDAWRFEHGQLLRRFVHDSDQGPEAGVETLDSCEIEPIELDGDDDASQERALRSHRGTTFLSAELGAPVLPALVAALFEADRRVAIRILEPDPDAIRHETARLNRVLGRADGRGAFVPPPFAGLAAPAPVRAFIETYDWADPRDPSDLFRELAIGKIEGTLHFLREHEVAQRATRAGAEAIAARQLFPIAALKRSALGATGAGERTLALGGDGELLQLIDERGQVVLAGPTFGELLRYLALGWKQRDEIEEDLIGALMLRARVRADAEP